MLHIDWDSLPLEELPIDKLVIDENGIQPEHVFPTAGVVLSSGPIHVEALLDGRAFVHNGRHRMLRALHGGETTISARIYGKATA